MLKDLSYGRLCEIHVLNNCFIMVQYAWLRRCFRWRCISCKAFWPILSLSCWNKCCNYNLPDFMKVSNYCFKYRNLVLRCWNWVEIVKYCYCKAYRWLWCMAQHKHACSYIACQRYVRTLGACSLEWSSWNSSFCVISGHFKTRQFQTRCLILRKVLV